jgi:hypothetical protein
VQVKAVRFFETSVIVYQTARRNVREDLNPQKWSVLNVICSVSDDSYGGFNDNWIIHEM